MNGRFTAWLVGSGSLLRSCGEILLRRGYPVSAVITEDVPTRTWASRSGIALADRLDSVVADPPDYLFSLANSRILTAAELGLPRRFAVNSHYGPLPAYAGLNAQHWAIARGERTYGISWHVMSTGIDDGDILLQRSFAVPDQATTFDLNVRCLRTSVESFPALVDELTGGSTGMSQDRGARTYFSRATPVARACVLDWTVPAEVTARQCRATQTGPFDNTFGVLRWVTEHSTALVRSATAIPVADGPSGTVVVDDESAPRLTTTDGTLVVTRMSTLDGEDLVPGRWLRAQGLRSGTIAPRHDDLSTVETLAAQCLAGEDFWLRQLARQPSPLPIPEDDVGGEVCVTMPPAMTGSRCLRILAELTGTPVTAAWPLPELPALGPGLAALFATTAPVTAEPGRDPATQVAGILHHRGYLRDIVARHPRRQLATGPYPVSVGATDLPARQLAIRFDHVRGTVRLRSAVWSTGTLSRLARQLVSA